MAGAAPLTAVAVLAAAVVVEVEEECVRLEGLLARCDQAVGRPQVADSVDLPLALALPHMPWVVAAGPQRGSRTPGLARPHMALVVVVQVASVAQQPTAVRRATAAVPATEEVLAMEAVPAMAAA